jgi:hypothetical protein
VAAKNAARGIVKARFEAFGCAGQGSKIKPVALEVMAKRYAPSPAQPEQVLQETDIVVTVSHHEGACHRGALAHLLLQWDNHTSVLGVGAHSVHPCDSVREIP